MSELLLSAGLMGIVRAEAEAPLLPFPPAVFALISAAVFVVLAFVVWSYRDVANRHGHKTSTRAAPGHSSADGAPANGGDHH